MKVKVKYKPLGSSEYIEEEREVDPNKILEFSNKHLAEIFVAAELFLEGYPCLDLDAPNEIKGE